MPTFIDESGDTGHSRDSSAYFRLAAVWLPSDHAADAFRESVRQLRQHLSLSSSFEFKFAHPNFERRKAFFDNAMKHPFRFAVCAIDKLKGHWKTAPAKEQHWAAATCLAVDLTPTYHAAERPSNPLREQIMVDDNGDKKFLKAISIAFGGQVSRCHPGYPMIGNPRFRSSMNDEVMQLVDMICGATGAAIDGDRRWFELVKDRCLCITPLP